MLVSSSLPNVVSSALGREEEGGDLRVVPLTFECTAAKAGEPRELTTRQVEAPMDLDILGAAVLLLLGSRRRPHSPAAVGRSAAKIAAKRARWAAQRLT